MQQLYLKNAYKLLGLPQNSTYEEVKKAYRNKVKVTHPDRNSSPTAHDDFVAITEAYDLIKTSMKSDSSASQPIEHRREEARKKARRYARMRYENFIRSDYYKDQLAIETVGKVLVLLLLTFILILIPVMSLIYEGKIAFFSSLIIVIIVAPAILIYRKDLTVANITASFKRVIRLKYSWYFMILLFNLYVFFKIAFSTLIYPWMLIGGYLTIPIAAYFMLRFLSRKRISFAKSMLFTIFGLSCLLFTNYIFSHEIRKERHYYKKPPASTLLNFEGSTYKKYPGVRLFYKMDEIAEHDGLEFSIERGLFGLKVVKGYTFIEKDQ